MLFRSKNLNINNYNNYNYNPKIPTQDKENDDPRPIGGGLTADQIQNVSLPTTPCPHCGRSFNSNAFSKHIKICEKVFLQKRKAFNAQQYRFTDSEQASLMKKGAMKEKMNPLSKKKILKIFLNGNYKVCNLEQCLLLKKIKLIIKICIIIINLKEIIF